MAHVLLPVTNDPDSVVVYSLEGVNYVFRFRYNERAGAWFFDLSLEDGTALVTGRKIVISWPLFGWREVNASVPPGRLFACDTTDEDTDPTLDDLGALIILEYVESTDIG